MELPPVCPGMGGGTDEEVLRVGGRSATYLNLPQTARCQRVKFRSQGKEGLAFSGYLKEHFNCHKSLSAVPLTMRAHRRFHFPNGVYICSQDATKTNNNKNLSFFNRIKCKIPMTAHRSTVYQPREMFLCLLAWKVGGDENTQRAGAIRSDHDREQGQGSKLWSLRWRLGACLAQRRLALVRI